jgi:hypothetical protein
MNSGGYLETKKTLIQKHRARSDIQQPAHSPIHLPILFKKHLLLLDVPKVLNLLDVHVITTLNIVLETSVPLSLPLSVHPELFIVLLLPFLARGALLVV